jgi:hypothetical protein
VTTVPAKSEPTPDWLNDTWYWVFQLHVMLEAWVIVNVTDDAVPEAGTLPVPVQPVVRYCFPEPPDSGDVTDSVMPVPESNQPLLGLGESYEEITVR